MTKTLTTEQIEQVIDDCRKGAAMHGLFNKWIIEEVASELLRCRDRIAELNALANREAQPVALNGWRVTVNRTSDRQGIASISGPGVFCMEVPVEYSMLDFMEDLTAPPAPAVPTCFSDAIDDMENVMAWILRMPVPTEGATAKAGRLKNSIDACRSAMLAQPVSQGKLPPHAYRELVNTLRDTAVKYSGTDQLRERLNTALSQFIEPDHPHTRTAAPESGNDLDT